jgi:hypothetical protein
MATAPIKSGRIDGANLRGTAWARCGQRPGQHVRRLNLVFGGHRHWDTQGRSTSWIQSSGLQGSPRALHSENVSAAISETKRIACLPKRLLDPFELRLDYFRSTAAGERSWISFAVKLAGSPQFALRQNVGESELTHTVILPLPEKTRTVTATNPPAIAIVLNAFGAALHGLRPFATGTAFTNQREQTHAGIRPSMANC